MMIEKNNVCYFCSTQPFLSIPASMSRNQSHLVEQLDQLIQGCINGDRQSQSRLYGLFAGKMYVVCLRYSRNREEAEETLQEGFMKVFQFIRQFKFTGSFE